MIFVEYLDKSEHLGAPPAQQQGLRAAATDGSGRAASRQAERNVFRLLLREGSLAPEERARGAHGTTAQRGGAAPFGRSIVRPVGK
jgi:hypothetical protein